MKTQPHYPHHCTCESDPLDCGCGCRSCAHKKSHARDEQMKNEIREACEQNPDFAAFRLEGLRENTREFQRRNDFDNLPRRKRGEIWARAIAAPAEAHWEDMLSDN